MNDQVEKEEIYTKDIIVRRVNEYIEAHTTKRSIKRLIKITLSNHQVNSDNHRAACNLFSKKLWLSMRDKKVCEVCAEMDGAEVGIDEKFILGNGDELMFPGDINAKFAESIVGCRCTAMYSK
jgi:hypothetical protein